MSGRTLRNSAIAAGAVVSLVVSACGGGARQDAQEHNGRFAVEVPSATFPASQSLSQHAQMVITVRNADSKTIPDVAITITDANYGTTAQAFGERIDTPGRPNQNTSGPGLASASRPVWIVDRGPGSHGCQYACASGGSGGGVTAYSNTWALGALAPGHSATFTWTVTAVKPGTHVVHYQIAAGLNGNAIAELAGGQPPEGTFRVTIRGTPQQAYVDNQGKIVTSH